MDCVERVTGDVATGATGGARSVAVEAAAAAATVVTALVILMEVLTRSMSAGEEIAAVRGVAGDVETTLFRKLFNNR